MASFTDFLDRLLFTQDDESDAETAVSAVVRGVLAYFTGGYSETAINAYGAVAGKDNRAGAAGGAVGSSLSGGSNVQNLNEGETTGQKVDTSKASDQMQKPIEGTGNQVIQQTGTNQVNNTNINTGTGNKDNGEDKGGFFQWLGENPELIQVLGQGIASMSSPDEIDIMRERSRLNSRNYSDDNRMINLGGGTGSFGQMADQQRGTDRDVVGSYKEQGRDSQKPMPYVGAGNQRTTMNNIQRQQPRLDPQQYFDQTRQNRGSGLISRRTGGYR